MWKQHLQEIPNKSAITQQESLPLASSETFLFWACLNRLGTAMGLCKANLVK